MWLPYLPAVISYHYPIFTNINLKPNVVSSCGGFTLDQDVVTHWCNIENVMCRVINHLKPDAYTCNHKRPFYPSTYGYRGSFRKRKMAKECINTTLHSFHHMLAYISYLFASSDDPSFLESGCKAWYEDPQKARQFLEHFSLDNKSDSSHIFLKLLWSTLGEIRVTRNFVGVVVTYKRPYDYQSVCHMDSYGVPIYVSWSIFQRLQSYSPFPGSYRLKKWYPSKDFFIAFDQRQHSIGQCPPPRVPSMPSPAPPIPIDKNTGTSPQRYVELRKAAIASRTPKPLEWVSRERSAASFHPPGRSGAHVYEFVLVSTGESMQEWTRTHLTRAGAQLLWRHVKYKNLW